MKLSPSWNEDIQYKHQSIIAKAIKLAGKRQQTYLVNETQEAIPISPKQLKTCETALKPNIIRS